MCARPKGAQCHPLVAMWPKLEHSSQYPSPTQGLVVCSIHAAHAKSCQGWKPVSNRLMLGTVLAQSNWTATYSGQGQKDNSSRQTPPALLSPEPGITPGAAVQAFSSLPR